MSTQVRISDTTYKNLKAYCSQGEKPSMMGVIDLAVAEYLERKNGKDGGLVKKALDEVVKHDLIDPSLAELATRLGEGLEPS